MTCRCPRPALTLGRIGPSTSNCSYLSRLVSSLLLFSRIILSYIIDDHFNFNFRRPFASPFFPPSRRRALPCLARQRPSPCRVLDAYLLSPNILSTLCLPSYRFGTLGVPATSGFSWLRSCFLSTFRLVYCPSLDLVDPADTFALPGSSRAPAITPGCYQQPACPSIIPSQYSWATLARHPPVPRCLGSREGKEKERGNCLPQPASPWPLHILRLRQGEPAMGLVRRLPSAATRGWTRLAAVVLRPSTKACTRYAFDSVT